MFQCVFFLSMKHTHIHTGGLLHKHLDVPSSFGSALKFVHYTGFEWSLVFSHTANYHCSWLLDFRHTYICCIHLLFFLRLFGESLIMLLFHTQIIHFPLHLLLSLDIYIFFFRISNALDRIHICLVPMHSVSRPTYSVKCIS